MATAVLIIEDEETLARNMQIYLDRHGYDASACHSGRAGLAQLEQFKPGIVLLDFHLGDMTGLEVLTEIRQRDPQAKIIMITGQGNVQLAVDAMKAGAFDYLAKPVVLQELKLLIDKAVGEERRDEALSYYRQKDASGSGLESIIGDSPPMREVKNLVRQLVEAERGLRDNDPPAALIIGETGSGKELVARAIHYEGPRKGQPFIEVNCAAIPSNLLEAELFGYERGAFTDAKERKLGLVEAADGGTLFLDEIGELDLSMQVKLLKLLEEKSVRRLGGLRDSKVNVRIITATNRNLEEMVRDGKFRSDLFFRLRIIQIAVPALRQRGEDVILLARHFLAVHAGRYGKKDLAFSPAAERLLRNYSWPGNVREMRNALEQTVLLASGKVIEADRLPFCHALNAAQDASSGTAEGRLPYDFPSEGINLEQVERDLVAQALEHSAWNVSQAARMLGLSRDALRYRIEKFALKPDA